MNNHNNNNDRFYRNIVGGDSSSGGQWKNMCAEPPSPEPKTSTFFGPEALHSSGGTTKFREASSEANTCWGTLQGMMLAYFSSFIKSLTIIPLKQEEELKEIIATARDMEARWGHLFDMIIINNDTERAYHQLLAEINSLEREPQWVPSSWLHN